MRTLALFTIMMMLLSTLMMSRRTDNAQVFNPSYNAQQIEQKVACRVKVSTITLVDFTLPSDQIRLWVYKNGRIVFQTYVAHGTGSGGLYATRFSNIPESRTSSIGIYRTLDVYEGHNGGSLRLQGLEYTNSNAYNREIVVHGANYIGEGIKEGNSWGCFAVPMNVSKELINLIKDGTILIAYYPDKQWLETSEYLK